MRSSCCCSCSSAGNFAASEIALVSLRDAQVRRLAERGKRGQAVARLRDDPSRFLSAVQIGVTFAGFFAASYGGATLAIELRQVLTGLGLSAGLAATAALGGIRDKVTAGQTPAAPVFDSYARLSWNPSTRELEKIETQHEDNDATIARHGGTVGLYLDDGLSAWKAGVRRHDFEKLLQRARSGASQGIAVWHVDRLFRQPRDVERLIDLADHGFRVISSHGSRGLPDPDDRFILRIEVTHAARSSDDISRRIK